MCTVFEEEPALMMFFAIFMNSVFGFRGLSWRVISMFVLFWLLFLDDERRRRRGNCSEVNTDKIG